jgi:AcrR family transcriptional regulator
MVVCVVQVAERLTPNDYFGAAMSILAEDGVAGLTTTRLCQRLDVTRGSLYHHFESGPAFHDALIEHWERELVPTLLAAIDTVEPRARIDLLQHLALNADHDAEKAIRAWAHTNPTVAAALARVDAAREDMLARAFVDVGIGPSVARILSRIGFSLLIGAQQLDDVMDSDRLQAVLAEYRSWIDHRRTDQ